MSPTIEPPTAHTHSGVEPKPTLPLTPGLLLLEESQAYVLSNTIARLSLVSPPYPLDSPQLLRRKQSSLLKTVCYLLDLTLGWFFDSWSLFVTNF